MNSAIKSSLRWNHIRRQHYKGLYEALGDKRYLQQYYRLLYGAIYLRGRHCARYNGSSPSLL